MSSPVTIMPERPRRRWIWIAIAVATAVAVIVPATAVVPVAARSRHLDATSAYRRPVTALAVDAGSGEVTVRRGPAGVVRVQLYLTWALARSQPWVRQVWDGGTLQISLGSCRAGSTSARWPIRLVDLGTCDVHVTIEVPADVSVRVLATSGDVDVRAMTGDLHVQTASGDISVVDVSGPVWARTISGDISAAALASPRVDAGLASGDIRLVFADAPRRVSVTAISGDVAITVPPGARYRVSGRTDSGSRAVEAALRDSASDRAISVQTASGDARLRYGPA